MSDGNHLRERDHRRIENYLGSLAVSAPQIYEIGKGANVVLCNASEKLETVLERYSFRYSAERFWHLHKVYVSQAQAIFSKVDPLGNFAVYPDDLRSELPFPTITKSRLISNASRCTLLPLNYQRHWQDVGQVARDDIPFGQKNDKLVWRGTTTGKFLPDRTDFPYSSRFYVHDAKHRYENIDLGYSAIVQINENEPLAAALKQSLKSRLSMAEQLQSKFLLSLEGNDVASGLKWMLYSNSTVVMPKPVCESWACESFLVPFEHYVPVKHDLSDLDEVYEWCMAHLAECKDIAENGRRYISDFLNPEKEEAIKTAVASEYLKRVAFSVAPDLKGPDTNPPAIVKRAAELVSDKEAERAARLLKRGLELFPATTDQYGDPMFRKELMRLYLNESRYDDAMALILLDDPVGRPGWHNILFARAIESAGRPAQALHYWKEFLTTHPTHSEAVAAVKRLEA